MSKGDSEEQLARDRLREKLHRVRGPRPRVRPRVRGKKICIVCGKTKRYAEFSTHYWMADGRRPHCRLCGWEERWHRQLEWSAKHQPDGGSRKDMRKRMGFRQAEQILRKREYWRLSYAALGFEDRSFGSGALKSDKIKPKPFWWKVRMKEVIVKSRDTIRVLPEDLSHVVISIRCTGDTKAPIGATKATKDVLHLEFDDIDHRAWKIKEVKTKYRYFNPAMAKQVHAFIERYKNEVDVVVCQCAAGISRSAGMAAALSKFYFGTDEKFFKSGRYVPNMLVYRLMSKQLFGGFAGQTKNLPTSRDRELGDTIF